MFGLAPLDGEHLIQHALLSRAQLVVGGKRERRVLRARVGQRGSERLRGNHLLFSSIFRPRLL